MEPPFTVLVVKLCKLYHICNSSQCFQPAEDAIPYQLRKTNHLLPHNMYNVYKDKVDKLDMRAIVNQFVLCGEKTT